ncbi:hypothetical protein HOD66_03285 [Candidatus Woesearchaeota archaeon]|nr:hypothetical protein [Candidatus Woesearchaeota archaeon]
MATNPVQHILELRQQGLSDEVITQELTRKGMSPQDVGMAMEQADPPPMPGGGAPQMGNPAGGQDMPPGPGQAPMGPGQSAAAMPAEESNIYERVEAIVESMIDEKWDDLIAEVRKIVEWKDKIEEKQNSMMNDLEKLKEDFKTLHQGVLGKLEDYDHRMQDVGTELKAVGKVFKDVIPEFVDNVKELKDITRGAKRE